MRMDSSLSRPHKKILDSTVHFRFSKNEWFLVQISKGVKCTYARLSPLQTPMLHLFFYPASVTQKILMEVDSRLLSLTTGANELFHLRFSSGFCHTTSQ